MNIRLQPMTLEICRIYMQGFIPDPALFADPNTYKPYIYNESACDHYFLRYQQLGRVHMAVMLGSEPIGEVILKNIDYQNKYCAMGISLQHDRYKNKGYGTKAESLALNYAFTEMGMETVFADALINNQRSRHVLEKVGFIKTHQDDTFQYYRCDKATWKSLY